METADGRKIDVEFVSNVYQVNHHQVIQCNIRDITERKRNADALAAEHERLAVTIRSIGDGVITTDNRGNVDIMNQVAETLCGWLQDDARGKPLVSIFNIIDENTRELRENPVERVLATGETIELANHTVIISKDGTERIIADSAAPIKNRNNEIIGVVLIFRDMTEKYRLLEISQRNQKLESLGVLAGGIAHDFNNLMTGIFGNIDLAIQESRDSKVTQFLSLAINTIDRTRGLTQQLLTFAKGGAPVRKTTPLSPMIRETAEFALSRSNVSWTCDLAEDLWPCTIDKNQICQVFDNIILNAQQAMPAGGTVEITAINMDIGEKEHQSLEKGKYVKVSIKDHGVGISKKILARIFDPFFTTKLKGHGLGLATSHSIINRHGGTIDVESLLDAGSSFHVFLPASTQPVVPFEAPDVRHKGNGTIIVMDDEEIIRGTLGYMLEALGYSAVCRKDGWEALKFYTQETRANRVIAGLFFDLTVPGGMDGKTTVTEIRKLNSEIPVFVASGYANDPVMMNPVEYGFTASIAKPFKMMELAELLEKHMNKKP